MTQRVKLRDENWKVESRTESAGSTLYHLRSEESGETIAVLSPPDVVVPVAEQPVDLDRRALSPFGLWQVRHELLRLTSAYEGLAAMHAGRVQLEPYQLVPVARLFSDPRRSLLIADDVGLGKTVEAGLCMMELIARGFGKRILLVVPPGLIDQWVEEMNSKFGLQFKPIEDSASLDSAQTALAEGISPWFFHERVITSTEYFKRPDVHVGALRRPWDAIVVDEAHYLAESGSPANPYATKRTILGGALRKATRSLILLTATPHNGYRHGFRSLLELVEPTDATLAGDADLVARRVSRSMIRRLKQQITRTGPGGTRVPAFVPRAPVERLEVSSGSPAEAAIFAMVANYTMATQSAADTDRQELVSFAMQIVKKRMLSSRLALTRTIADRLDALKREPDDDGPTRADLRELQGDLPLPDIQAERITARVLRSSVARDSRRRNAEKRQLTAIHRALEAIEDLPDPKIERLIDDLRRTLLGTHGEKAIIFTEYRDTLEAIRSALDSHAEFAGTIVELPGGLSSRQRRDRIAAFSAPESLILLATDAASEGLNLQEHCRRLYHVELPWNPNRLEQRNGRIDRYGQRREPQIAYLFYADSPEDRVLDRLVDRISRMHGDRVSTPDILGVLEGTNIGNRLLAIATDEDAERESTTLNRVFDEGYREFSNELAPLLSTNGLDEDALIDATSADSLIADDLVFESAMLRALGTSVVALPHPHEYRVLVPTALQGPRVRAEYRALTFRRSVALADGKEGTDFVHRLHPLATALAANAQTMLTAAVRDVTLPACIAVRRLADLEGAAAAIFTYLEAGVHASGSVVSVGLHSDSTSARDQDVERALTHGVQPGDVTWDECVRAFGGRFGELRARAGDLALATLQRRATAEQHRRTTVAGSLRAEVEAYRADRIEELRRDEEAERTGARDQTELFRELRTNWGARRAGVATNADARLAAIAEWESVPDVVPPNPLGVLLVFPEPAA